MNKLSSMIVTLFNIGRFPIIPGTIGSLFSFLLLIPIYNYFAYNLILLFFLISLISGVFFINIYISRTGKNDPKEIVIDEFIGCFIIILFFPLFKNENIYNLSLLSFLLFRFFDVTKIFPANIIDKNMKNSYGIVLDDIIASIYTIVSLIIIYEYII